jgi:hypothetical protein
MGGDVSCILEESLPLPKAGNGAFPTLPIGDSVEICCIRIPLEEPILMTPLSPVRFLPP